MSGITDRSTSRATTGAATRMALVRHGETVWHEENRYAGGSSDIDLTERGIVQAHALADWARRQRFDAVVSSPVRRALETARPSAASVGVEVETIDALREVDFGVAEGRTAAELHDLDAEMLHRFRDDPVAHPFPGAESPEDAARRGAEALRRIARSHPGGSVLVVAHNTLLRLSMCQLLELRIADYRRTFPRLDNAAVTTLSVPVDDREAASLLSLNVHLVDEPDEATDHHPDDGNQ